MPHVSAECPKFRMHIVSPAYIMHGYVRYELGSPRPRHNMRGRRCCCIGAGAAASAASVVLSERILQWIRIQATYR